MLEAGLSYGAESFLLIVLIKIDDGEALHIISWRDSAIDAERGERK
jgi:hypothetical protein